MRKPKNLVGAYIKMKILLVTDAQSDIIEGLMEHLTQSPLLSEFGTAYNVQATDFNIMPDTSINIVTYYVVKYYMVIILLCTFLFTSRSCHSHQ